MLNQMYEDVPSSIMLDKAILNELVIENVIPSHSNKIQKGEFLLAFFFISTKIKVMNKVMNE